MTGGSIRGIDLRVDSALGTLLSLSAHVGESTSPHYLPPVNRHGPGRGGWQRADFSHAKRAAVWCCTEQETACQELMTNQIFSLTLRVLPEVTNSPLLTSRTSESGPAAC